MAEKADLRNTKKIILTNEVERSLKGIIKTELIIENPAIFLYKSENWLEI